MRSVCLENALEPDILKNMASRRKIQCRPRNEESCTDPIKDAIDYGIDIQMLIDNLKRSPIERILRHQIALDTMRMLQKAKRI